MRIIRRAAVVAYCFCLAAVCGRPAVAAERTERFDKDPGWDGHNHRIAAELPPATVRQEFGYSDTAHAGSAAGEIGGSIAPAAEPAYYAKKIPAATFDQPLSASGKIACTGKTFHLLVGFFNADTVNEWRTPNTIALRLMGRGEKFFAFVEYATGHWRAGGDSPRSFPTVRDPATGRSELIGFARGTLHRWSLKYAPQANEGRGAVIATIDDQTAVCNLDEGHKQDGATFNRFGMLNVLKSVDSGGEVWLDDVSINGQTDDFAKDPGWDALNNRRTYTTRLIRPRFDFGFSPTHFAGGRGSGELGGVVFRGDCRYPERMAYYGDRLHELTLERPIKASGKVALRRGVSDSGVLLGFFHSKDSTASNPSQEHGLPANFLGISTDAPSRDGFYFAPTYRLGQRSQSQPLAKPARLRPDGSTHDWTFGYLPTAAGGQGSIIVTLDREKMELPLAPGHKQSAARFDRFGIISTWIDGNSQTIYFDDLTYTAAQE